MLEPDKLDTSTHAASGTITKSQDKISGWDTACDASDKDDDIVERTPRKKGNTKRNTGRCSLIPKGKSEKRSPYSRTTAKMTSRL